MKIQEYMLIFDYFLIIAVISEMVYVINHIIAMFVNSCRGRKLKRARLRARIPIAELAAFSGVPRWKIRLMEKGSDGTAECYKELHNAIRDYWI